MFCPTLTFSLVKPYIILTFLSNAAVWIFHRKVVFVSIVSNSLCVVRCHIPTVVLSQKLIHGCGDQLNKGLALNSLKCRNLKKLTEDNKSDSLWRLFVQVNQEMMYIEWPLQHKVKNDNVLLFDVKKQRVSFPEQQRCHSWHGAMSSCLAKALQANSADSFLDKSVS